MPGIWAEHGGVFIPMYQTRGTLDIISIPLLETKCRQDCSGKGECCFWKTLGSNFLPDENDYLVCPPQPWLDGINAGEGYIRQFVAMPLGMGYTVEAQVTGEEKFGGIQIIAYEPKPGKFPDEPPQPSRVAYRLAPSATADMAMGAMAGGAEMGLAAAER